MRMFKRQSRGTVKSRQGVAMVMVLMVMAAAAVMGYALLASATLQGQVANAGIQQVSSNQIAESGVNVAMYYLQYPNNAPSLTNGYWNGQTGISFGSSVSRSVARVSDS